MLAFRTLGKRRLLSSTSLPQGERRVREQAVEIPFFRSLLAGLDVGSTQHYHVTKSATLPLRGLYS
jgi:hypothetical protein